MKQRLLLDGAMGTELIRHGAGPDSCLAAENLRRPELVAAIHAAYRNAGADVLSANTFGANRYRLAAHGLETALEAINRAGVRIAREQAAGAIVAASVGPTGLQPDLPSPAELESVYRQQAEALEGVDAFSLETFGDVGELRSAIRGIRQVSAAPIWAQTVYVDSGRTPTGPDPEEVLSELADLDIQAIGANCAIGEATVEAVTQALSKLTDMPLIAQPNAGQPRKVDGTLRYPIGPQEFAKTVEALSERVSIVGGCCGTTPAHIYSVRWWACSSPSRAASRKAF